MGRLAWSQLRFRTGRALALLLGMLLAATAFSVLTAASRTSQLRTIGMVRAHFQPAYDILVRPRGSRTPLEVATGTVQPNFLSGIYGGITMAQYRQIQQIPGVQVAAPIAMVGYILLLENLPLRLPAAEVARPGRQLYRFETTWVSSAGTRITQPASYTYITPRLLNASDNNGDTLEELPGGRAVDVCPPQSPGGAQPFGLAAQSASMCWSRVNGLGTGPGGQSYADLTAAHPGDLVTWMVPLLIAAIDPAAEMKLDELNHAVISGRYLTENASPAYGVGVAGGSTAFPVLAANDSGMNEYALTQMQELPRPTAPPVMNVRWLRSETAVRGRYLTTARTTAQQAYMQLLHDLSPSVTTQSFDAFWTVGPTSYRRDPSGALTPVLVHNPLSVWQSYVGNYVPMDEKEAQYRAITSHAPRHDGIAEGTPVPVLTGVFDPARIPAFDPLSQVPLGPYQPVSAFPADAASRQALAGQDLLPNQNLGAYVSQPVDLITSLGMLPALQNAGIFTGNLRAADPISVIRVRVAGVTGPNPLSLERIREVAQQIATRTGLDVDIVAGSSPSPTRIDVLSGPYGQPRLALTEDWVRMGVAVSILTAVDKKSIVLFVLILLVGVLFVANSATAAVRGRRRELGVLACLGWTRPRLFTAVLGEVAGIGLIAGGLSAAAALPLSAALGLHASGGRALLAVPVAIAVAITAGVGPAWLAARAEPLSAVRQPVLPVRRVYSPAGLTTLALVNVLRTPGRTLVAAVSLAIGVAALTLLAAMTLAFRGVIVGSLLGDAVAVQVRGVDYIAVVTTISLGVLAVADVVFLNIRERAAELATLRAFGWPESALARLVVTEGIAIGLSGSVVGAALGSAAATAFSGQSPAILYAVAAAAATAGVLVTAAAALVPAQLMRLLAATQLLAED